MILRIDHLGIAVESIDGALGIYQDLGLVEVHREEVASQKVVAAFLPAGESRLELLEPTGPDSPIARFLQRRGPGIHHICFAVDDIDGALALLKNRGYRLINETPVPGADGRRVAFLHPAAGNGILIELSSI